VHAPIWIGARFCTNLPVPAIALVTIFSKLEMPETLLSASPGISRIDPALHASQTSPRPYPSPPKIASPLSSQKQHYHTPNEHHNHHPLA
jgi:hypothetical protein